MHRNSWDAFRLCFFLEGADYLVVCLSRICLPERQELGHLNIGGEQPIVSPSGLTVSY